MYTPKSFEEPHREEVLNLIESNGFGTLVSWSVGEMQISHIPLLLEHSVPGEERLLGHVASANDHWKMFDGKRPAIAIFRGVHGYVSPFWLSTCPVTPTWNYTAVHAHGAPRVLDAGASQSVIQRLTEKYEARLAHRSGRALPEGFVADALDSLVAFEMPIERFEAKFKLSQNRGALDREGILTGLASEPDSGSQELAEFSRDYFVRRDSRKSQA
jgi:transcriptional regulator